MATSVEPHLDIHEVRQQARNLAEHRRAARRDYERYSEQAADADRDYRKAKARKFLECRSAGTSVAQSEIEADAESADDRHRRDIAQSLAKSCLLRIEELEADRAMLRQIGDWSRGLETIG